MLFTDFHLRHLLSFIAIMLASIWTTTVAGESTTPASPIEHLVHLNNKPHHCDFPAFLIDQTGNKWVSYTDYDGTSDVLKLARVDGDAFVAIADVSTPGVVHQPAMTVAGDGTVWIFWGQVDARDVVTLRARSFKDGKLSAEQTLASTAGSDSFADAATDHAGRVWVTWQSFRRGQGDVFARWLDPTTGTWSDEIAVSTPEGGNWEPRIAIDKRDEAWIVFDSSRGGEFNLYLAHVTRSGRESEVQLTNTPDYEARASIAINEESDTIWIAAERGRQRWGLPARGHENDTGINAQKRILLGSYSITEKSFSEIPVPMSGVLTPINVPPPRIPGKPTVKVAPWLAEVVNLPIVTVDAQGDLWLSWRYYIDKCWQLGVTRITVATKQWAKPRSVPSSTFCQDRHARWSRQGNKIWLCWSSDQRTNKKVGTAGLFLGTMTPVFDDATFANGNITMSALPKAKMNPDSPIRARNDHDVWEIGGKKYYLVWGDLHRHTDFSNCRTPFDGCLVEHYRYAIDMAVLDFLGTSDHTDIAKILDPYEWWQTQRAVDVFYMPNRFLSLYAYEREQKFPWGHRNVMFAQRGAPVVYINRKNYQASPWFAQLPLGPGDSEILPTELWEVLGRYGKPTAVISHTGATGMGTDWDRYKNIDNTVENVVEIFQGARVSYEGLGAAQPTAGLDVDEPYTPSSRAKKDFVKPPTPILDFGETYNKGVYQRALSNGFKLGVFASSDHIAQSTSFGGVYVESLTREGIIEGFKARRTIAGTTKIYAHISCQDQPGGSLLNVSGKPSLTISVTGTAPLTKITLVRNEADYQVFTPTAAEFSTTVVDDKPLPGENRYYLRIEQSDGNMAWTSPLWILVNQ